MSTRALSVVIPTLDAAAKLPAALTALEEGRCSGLVAEVVVADGGSADGTVSVAERAGARVVRCAEASRGRQLAEGAAAARGAWLLFVHADTRLAPGWAAAAGRFIGDPAMAGRAGYFRLALDDGSAQARRVERLANWRARHLGLPYGDQGLLISKACYEALGGFQALPLMEDVALVRRLGRRRLVALPAAALTSAVRYRQGGWWRRPLRNVTLLGLFYAGLPPVWLRRLYG